MKKSFERILSLIIALALVFALVPATVSATGTTLVYDMVYDGAADGASIEAITYSDTNNTWKFAGKHANAALITANLKGHGTNAFLAVNQWWAVTLNVPTAGVYNLSLKHSVGSASGDVGVYFGAATSTPDAIMTSNEAVNTVPFYADKSTTAGTTTPIGSVVVPAAGEYTVIFKAVANGAGGKSRQYIKEVILDYTGEAPKEPDDEEVGIKVVYNMNTDKVEGGGWIDVVNFSDTNGFWKYETAYKAFSSSAFVQENSNGFGVEAAYGLNAWWAMRIYVPKSGSYALKLNHICYANGGTANVYFGTPEEGATAIVAKEPVGTACFYSASQTAAEDETVGTIDVAEAGEYILVFKSAKAGDGNGNGTKNRQIFKQVILEAGEATVPMLDISVSAEKISVGETATVTATSALMSDGTTASNVTVTYSVKESDASVASVDADGIVTGLSAGEAEIIATATRGNISVSRSIVLTVEKAKPGISVEDTTVSIAAMPENAAYGSVSGVENIVGEVEMGTEITLTATPNDGYKFAFWKNSSGKLLSINETESFVVNTNTAITAVFDKIADGTESEASVSLYNANGMLFYENKSIEENTLFYDAIKAAGTPMLTGYVFSHWSAKEDSSKVADDVTVEGIMRATAVYNDSNERYDITVNGEAFASGKKYGEQITVESNDNNFVCWKLGDKIISYEKSYSFFVWDDVALTEVKEGTAEAVPIAVISKSGDNCHLTYSVPEGYTKIEAGIIFGSGSGITIDSTDGYKVAETLGTGQLTVSSDCEYARGYIIFKTPTNEIRIVYAD